MALAMKAVVAVEYTGMSSLRKDMWPEWSRWAWVNKTPPMSSSLR